MNPIKLFDNTLAWLFIIVLVSVIILSAFWHILPGRWQMNESSDYLSYYAPVARNLLNGQGLIRADGSQATKYPPGYPLFLTIIFQFAAFFSVPEIFLITISTGICITISALLIFAFGRSLYGSTLAFIPTFIWLTYPFMLWVTKQPNSEIIFLPVFLGVIVLFWHTAFLAQYNVDWRFLAIGFLVGISMLIRPASIGLGIVLFFVLWMWRRKGPVKIWLLPGGLILLGNLLVVLPWQVWLYEQTGQIVLLSTNGPASIRDGLTFAVSLKGYRLPLDISQDIEYVMRSFINQTFLLDSIGDIFKAIWLQLSIEPVGLFKLVGWKALRTWYATDSHRLELQTLVIQVFYLSVISLGIVVAWQQRGKSRNAVLLILLIMFYFWLMTVLVLSILRYMIPTMALLLLFIPYALKLLQSRLISKKRII